MLNDKHFIWNEKHTLQEYINATQSVLFKSPNLILVDQQDHWATFICRVCWEYGVNPAWVLVSFEREQGLLTNPTLKPWSYEAATGFVGQDQPGTSSPLYLGLPNQIWREIRQTAWLGIPHPTEMFSQNPKLWPSEKRWNSEAIAPFRKELLDSPGSFYICNFMCEYIQLEYTPHLAVLASNGKIYQDLLAQAFDPLL